MGGGRRCSKRERAEQAWSRRGYGIRGVGEGCKAGPPKASGFPLREAGAIAALAAEEGHGLTMI